MLKIPKVIFKEKTVIQAESKIYPRNLDLGHIWFLNDGRLLFVRDLDEIVILNIDEDKEVFVLTKGEGRESYYCTEMSNQRIIASRDDNVTIWNISQKIPTENTFFPGMNNLTYCYEIGNKEIAVLSKYEGIKIFSSEIPYHFIDTITGSIGKISVNYYLKNLMI